MKAGAWAIFVSGLVIVGAGAGWLATRPIEDSIDATVALNTRSCSDPALPVAVTLKNRSSRMITWTTFDVGTKRRGYSSELTRDKHPTDKIIGPREEVVWCVPKPTSLWFNGDRFPAQGTDLPEQEIEYFVEVVKAEAG